MEIRELMSLAARVLDRLLKDANQARLLMKDTQSMPHNKFLFSKRELPSNRLIGSQGRSARAGAEPGGN